jgi:hypothetical protein
MNPTAIYSKSGKGVQEAAGKTSILGRPDRAVLSAIDGRATLADVAQKCGKPFDQAFQNLITKLDKDGFIREVSAGTAAPAGAAAKPAAAKPASKPAAPADPASDLDFSSLGVPARPAAAPKAAPPPPPKPAAPPPPPPKEQESALFKARQEAEAKAQAERDRQRKEAEDKFRAETEAKLRAEAEAKAKAEAEARIAAEAEAKVKAAREAAVKAAAEAKAKAEAEAKRAREEAEAAKREAEERERKAREEAERIRKEAEARERKAREEAERIRREAEAKAEAERKALEAERRKLEEEKRRREEESRREEEEREARRRAREEEEQREAAEREARRKAREEEEQREAAEREARRKAREEEEAREEARAAEERAAKKAKKKPAREEEEPAPAPKAAAAGGGFADSLMADLDSFNTREEEESKAKEEAERKAKLEAEKRAREEAERREKEEAEQRAKEEKRRAKEEKERLKREEEERLRREQDEEKERMRAEEERRKQEAEERAAKAKQEEALARKASSQTTGGYESEDKRRKRALEVGPRDPSLMQQRRQRSWGKPVALTLFLVLVVALAIVHFMPINTQDYEQAASEALGRPVRIRSAGLSLITGLQLRLEGVSVGDVKIARVIAHPSIASLTESKKVFSTLELERVSLPQEAIGQVLFARAASDNFSVGKVVVRNLELAGPLALPKDLQAEVSLDPAGTVRGATLRGAGGLLARLDVQGGNVEFGLDASTFALPFAPEIAFAQFGMKGTANAQGMQVKQWDAQALDGTLSGAARVRWGGTWTVDGVITARGINAAVFAPALLSEGRGEGTGKFHMSGVEPGKLGSGARLDGNFTVNKGVLGSFDLSRAIQTGGKQAQGRTQFTEMNGQVSYDRGEVELRNITIGAGALNAGASAVISPKGALSGRIVADVRTASQTLRATLLLGGTVKEPQVRN